MRLTRLEEKSAQNWLLGNDTRTSVVFTLCAVIPALLISTFVREVGLLVKITGSYPGLCIMFLFPTLMVYFARKRKVRDYGDTENPFQSMFGGLVGCIIVWSFCVIAFGLVTYGIIHDAIYGVHGAPHEEVSAHTLALF